MADGVEFVLGKVAEVYFAEVAVFFTPPRWFPCAPPLTDAPCPYDYYLLLMYGAPIR